MNRVWGLCLVLSVSACGDDDGALDAGADSAVDATEFDGALDASTDAEENVVIAEGLYEIVEVRSFEDEGGTLERTLRRDTTPMAIRGRIGLSATSTGTYDMNIVIAMLDDGLLEAGDPVTVETFALTLEGSTAVAEIDTDRFQVFDVEVEGDELRMNRNADDPRDNLPLDEGPSAIVMRAIADASIQGTFDLVEFTDAETGEVVDSSTCFPEDAGSSRFSIEFTMDPRGSLTIQETTTQFSDAECMTETGSEMRTPVGLVEDEGSTLRLWSVADDAESSMFLEFSYTFDDDLVLTRTACAPAPECETDGPSQVVLRQR